MTELSNSKTDKLACSIHAFADGVALLDDNFGDSEGNIHITNVDDALKLGAMGIAVVKNIYACQGKKFEIKIPGLTGIGADVLELIVKLISKIGNGDKAQKQVDSGNSPDTGVAVGTDINV